MKGNARKCHLIMSTNDSLIERSDWEKMSRVKIECTNSILMIM